MTPYELRFNIFKHASNLVSEEYQSEMAVVFDWNNNETNTVKMNPVEYPSFEKILSLAERINSFVSG